MFPGPSPNKSISVISIVPGATAKATAFSQIAFTLDGAALPLLLVGVFWSIASGELPLGVPGGVLCFFDAGASPAGAIRCWPSSRISTSPLRDGAAPISIAGIGDSAGSGGNAGSGCRGGRNASATASESAAVKDLRIPWSGFALLSITTLGALRE